MKAKAQFEPECPAFSFRGLVYEGRPIWVNDDGEFNFDFGGITLCDYKEPDRGSTHQGQFPTLFMYNDDDGWALVKPLTESARALKALCSG